jgi:hypothetical protein
LSKREAFCFYSLDLALTAGAVSKFGDDIRPFEYPNRLFPRRQGEEFGDTTIR